MTTELHRNKFLEAILELGRNWALAVAISSAGAAAFYTETVDGPVQWERHVFVACLLVSIVWIGLATLRFDEVLSSALRKRGKLHIALGLVVFSALCLGGILLVLQVGKFADNNAIVKLCESKMDQPESRIHRADECVRLRDQRKTRLDRLESN